MTPGRLGALIVALLTVAGLAVVVRESAGGPASRLVVAPGPTVVVPAAGPQAASPAAAMAAAPATTAVTRRPASAASAAAPSATVSASTVVPGPVSAPPLGRYRYRYAGSGSPVEGLLTVTAGPGSGRQTDKADAGDAAEQTVVEWSPGARTTVSAGTGASSCTWSPGLLSLKLPMGTGSAWRADSTCTETSSTVHRVEDATVEGVTRTTIAGKAVDVWVISRHSITEVVAAPSTKAVVEAQSSELFAPSLGLVVYQVTRTATPQADGTTATTTQTAELLDASPV